MNSLYIRLDGEQGERIKQLMIDRDCSAQKAGAHILRSFFNKSADVTIETTSRSVTVTKKPAKKFTKPSVDEIAREFQAKGSYTCLDDADSFFNHYESNGWKVGKNSMKNWKATVAQWHKRNKEGTNNGKDQSKAISGRDAITFKTTDF